MFQYCRDRVARLICGTMLLLLLTIMINGRGGGCQAFQVNFGATTRKISMPGVTRKGPHPLLLSTTTTSTTCLFSSNNGIIDEEEEDDDEKNALAEAGKLVLGWAMIGSYLFGWAIVLGFYFLPFVGLEFQNNNGRLGIGSIEPKQEQQQVVIRNIESQEQLAAASYASSSVLSANSDVLWKNTVQQGNNHAHY